jgi:hypothetical protein
MCGICGNYVVFEGALGVAEKYLRFDFLILILSNYLILLLTSNISFPILQKSLYDAAAI